MKYPEYQITEESKAQAIRIRELLKTNNADLLGPSAVFNSNLLTPRIIEQLETMNQLELVDWLKEIRACGLSLADIIAEVMVDEVVGEELKQMAEEINEP